MQRTRIEGHFGEKFNPALTNVKDCNGLRVTGEAMFDGTGRPIRDLFWKLHRAAPNSGNFPNGGVPRARLALIENSRGVTVEGITFKDSQFRNLHLYKCDGVTFAMRGSRCRTTTCRLPARMESIRIAAGTVERCYFSVTDDCIAVKGSSGPHATEDRDSAPVEHIRVRDCVSKRGSGIMAPGREATLVRDVIVERFRVIGNVLKLRSDMPQHSEDIHCRYITIEATGGTIISARPWFQ